MTRDCELSGHLFICFLQLLLAVGTKLEHVITQLAQEVAEKHSAVEGDLVVNPSDDHFWFGRPKIVLYLIHFILFQNAFEIAFFFWILVSATKRHRNYRGTKTEGLLQLLFSLYLFDRLPTVSTPASWTTSPSLCRGSLSGKSADLLAPGPISHSRSAINMFQTHGVSLAGPSSSSSVATAPCLCTRLSRRCVPLYFA